MPFYIISNLPVMLNQSHLDIFPCYHDCTVAVWPSHLAKENLMSTKNPVIAVNPKFKGTYRGARANWHGAMSGFVGQPVSAFVAHVTSKGNCPSMPKTGKLASKPEPVTGWVSFLTLASKKNGGTPAFVIK